MIKYPEHEKLKALNGANQTIGEFLDWLGGEGYWICRESIDPESHQDFDPSFKTQTMLIADFCGVDRNKLEAEKCQMLDELRKANGG